MTQDELTIKLVESLAKLDATMNSIQSQISNHDKRLSRLEQDEKPNLKSNIIEWLVKGLVIAVISIASLSGAAGIVSKIFVK